MKISIITVNYNDAIGLDGTIRSVIDQKNTDFEHIIIDGGSTDESVEVINQYADKIDYWVSEKDRGIYHAMNKGVAQAHGDYCLFLNSGDFFYNDAVLNKIQDLRCNEDIIVGKVVSKDGRSPLFLPPSRDISLYYLYSGTVPHQGAFIKTDLLRKIPYDENLKIVSDWKFFLEAIIFNNCSIRYIDEYIAKFDTTGISTSYPDKMWKEKERVLSELFPHRVLADYRQMKTSECLTQKLMPQLRQHYTVDKIVYCIGVFFLKFVK
jgi:glycosyltransferase involved in cell wall biosynthesis